MKARPANEKREEAARLRFGGLASGLNGVPGEQTLRICTELEPQGDCQVDRAAKLEPAQSRTTIRLERCVAVRRARAHFARRSRGRRGSLGRGFVSFGYKARDQCAVFGIGFVSGQQFGVKNKVLAGHTVGGEADRSR